MSAQYKVCPLFWSDYGGKRTLMNMGAFEELLNEGWQILRGGYHAANGIA